MKSILGIVAEYNPPHKGHARHIRLAREASGCDAVVVVMSGPFVQRGEPALFSKFDRAGLACRMGADLVVELPVLHAVDSAQGFASGGVGILSALGCDSLSFGAECTDLALLTRAAELLLREPEELSQSIREFLAKGYSHPAARREALARYAPELAPLINRSNNILAVEYLCALSKTRSPMKVYPILREGSDYRSEASPENVLPSATAVRGAILRGDDSWRDMVPPGFSPLMEALPRIDPKDLDLPLRYALLRLSEKDLTALPAGAEGLPRRLVRLAEEHTDLESLVSAAVTRRYSEARIRRTLLYAMLDIRESDLAKARSLGAPYARVLSLGEHGRELVGELSRRSRIPLVLKKSELPEGDLSAMYSRFDETAQDLWATLTRTPWRQDRTRRLI